MCGAYRGCLDETKLGEQTLKIRSLVYRIMLNILVTENTPTDFHGDKIRVPNVLKLINCSTLLFHYTNKILTNVKMKQFCDLICDALIM